MNLSLFIAKKIRKKGDRSGGLSGLGSAIATASVAVSVAVMLVSLAVASGFKYEIRGKITGTVGDVMLAAPGQQLLGASFPVDRNPSYLEAVRALSDVAQVEAVAYLPGILRRDGEVEGIVLKGVDSTYSLSFFARFLVAGRLPDFGGEKPSDELLLSEATAARLQVGPGDRLEAYCIEDRVRVRRFTVTGLYRMGLEELEKTFAVADLRQVQRLCGWTPERVTGLEVRSREGADPDAVFRAVEQTVLERETDDDPPLVTQDVRKQYAAIFDWLELLDLNVIIILSLMVAVAGFNMISGLLILIFEKIRMIGLLKALGMRGGPLRRIFVYRGMDLVLRGMLWGNLAALVCCLMQAEFRIIGLDASNYFVDHVPVRLTWWGWAGVDLIALVCIYWLLWLPVTFIGRVSPARTLQAD